MNVNEIRELTASELDFVSGGVTTSFDSGFSWSGLCSEPGPERSSSMPSGLSLAL